MSENLDKEIKEQKLEVSETSVEVSEVEVAPVEVTPVEPDKDEHAQKLEAVAEESVVIEEPAPKPNAKAVFYPLEEDKTDLSAEDMNKIIEENRSKFMKNYNKGKRIQMISFGVIVVLFIAALILMFLQNNQLQWLLYTILGLAVVAFIGAMIINSKFKKSAFSSIDDYVSTYFAGFDSYAFGDKRLIDAKMSTTAKIINDEVIQTHYFDVINSINSRNRVEAEYLGRLLTATDAAVRVPASEQAATTGRKKTDNIGFYGRFFSYDFAYEGPHFIVLRKGDNDVCTALPTYLDGYEQIIVEGLDERFVVYTSDVENGPAALNGKIVEALKNHETNPRLLDYFVTINNFGIRVGCNYSDELMAVPLEKPLSVEVVDQHRIDVSAVLDLIAAVLNKE